MYSQSVEHIVLLVGVRVGETVVKVMKLGVPEVCLYRLTPTEKVVSNNSFDNSGFVVFCKSGKIHQVAEIQTKSIDVRK